MINYEKQTRKIAKSKCIYLRNISSGVRAYLPNGVDKITFNDWEEAYNFIIDEYEEVPQSQWNKFQKANDQKF
jgi:hypothetical protein